MKTITVLGNNSGRNAGDNAILGNLLDDFSRFRQDICFRVPTLNASFIRENFGHHAVEPMGQMPWNLAVKNFGLPLFRAMTDTDMVLITDNILFDRNLNNPLVNYLQSIALFAPFCRKKGIPIVFYNASIGPIDSLPGKRALQKVMDASRLVIARDENTRDLIQTLQISHPEVVIHADCALNTTPISQEHLEKIIDREKLFVNPRGTIGFNVNSYIDNWSKTGTLSREDFVGLIAGAADILVDQLNVDILFVVTQVMDAKITGECVQRMRRRGRARTVSNKQYSYLELAALLEKLELHVGLRTHSLIFCAAVNTPMININAYPKSAGFMHTIGQGDWTIDFADLSRDSLTTLMLRAWERREQTRLDMAPQVAVEKKKARDSVRLVSDLLDEV